MALVQWNRWYMSEDREMYYVEMESARNTAEDAYFAARPRFTDVQGARDLFRAGFERGFDLLWCRIVQLEAKSKVPPLPPMTRCPSCKLWYFDEEGQDNCQVKGLAVSADEG